MSATQKTDPKTAIWTGLFALIAGGVLLAIDSPFGWGPIAFGAILVLVGIVGRNSVRNDRTENGTR